MENEAEEKREGEEEAAIPVQQRCPSEKAIASEEMKKEDNETKMPWKRTKRTIKQRSNKTK